MGIVRRMGTPDPDPTGAQLFGATGVLFALCAAAGIAYAVVECFRWALSK